MSSCVAFISLKSCKHHLLTSALILALFTACWSSLDCRHGAACQKIPLHV